MFGGLTHLGSGVSDAYTISSLLQRRLGSGYDVYNYGETAFSQRSGVEPAAEGAVSGNVPDVVIFYDGFNDAYASVYSPAVPRDPQNERSRQQTLTKSFYHQVIGRSNMYTLRLPRTRDAYYKQQSRPARWDQDVAPKAAENFPRRRSTSKPVFQAKAIAKAYGFKVFFFWQPHLLSGTRKTQPYERGDHRNVQSGALLVAMQQVYRDAKPRLSGREDENIFASHGKCFSTISTIAKMATAISRFDGSAVRSACADFGALAAAATGSGVDVFQDDEQLVAVWGHARFTDAGLAELAQRHGIAQALAQGHARKRTDVFAALSGSFALAILNGRSGEAVLAIDRMGTHPLCYSVAGGTAGVRLHARRDQRLPGDQVRGRPPGDLRLRVFPHGARAGHDPRRRAAPAARRVPVVQQRQGRNRSVTGRCASPRTSSDRSRSSRRDFLTVLREGVREAARARDGGRLPERRDRQLDDRRHARRGQRRARAHLLHRLRGRRLRRNGVRAHRRAAFRHAAPRVLRDARRRRQGDTGHRRMFRPAVRQLLRGADLLLREAGEGRRRRRRCSAATAATSCSAATRAMPSSTCIRSTATCRRRCAKG